MEEFSVYKDKRTDHEIRIWPKVLERLSDGELIYESVFRKKVFPELPGSRQYLSEYLKSGKLDAMVIRTLPMNSKSLYMNCNEYLLQQEMKREEIPCKAMIQLPNPNFVSIQDFKALIDGNSKTIYGFELISEWLGLQTGDRLFWPYIELCLEYNLVPCIEVDHYFRKNMMPLNEAIALLMQFKMKQLWLPHLGCGAFLYSDIFNGLSCKIILLSSVPKSQEWIGIARAVECENMQIAYASDAPFDGGKCYDTYNSFYN